MIKYRVSASHVLLVIKSVFNYQFSQLPLNTFDQQNRVVYPGNSRLSLVMEAISSAQYAVRLTLFELIKTVII